MSKKHAPPPKRKPVPSAAKGRHGLGRGLGALISDPATEPLAPTEAEPTTDVAQGAGLPKPQKGQQVVMSLPVGEISRCPWQPRAIFEPGALHDLAESIKAHGVIQPLVCRKAPSGGGFELIVGERRLRAAIEAGYERVPVIVIEAADRDAAEMAVIENIQREDLNVIEEAEGYRTLTETFNLTQQEVADRVGKSRPAVSNAMRLLDLPDEVKHLLSSSLLSTGHAKVLLGVSDPDEQTILSHKCVTEGVTVRGLERLIVRRQEARTGTAAARLPTPDLPDAYLKDLADRMNRHFGTHVRLTASQTYANGKRAKGSIEVDFYDNDDLDRLLTLLGITVD